MKHARRALATMAVSTLIGCSSIINATTPTTDLFVLPLCSVTSTATLVTNLTQSYQITNPHIRFETETGNFSRMLQKLTDGEVPYFISNHLPSDPNLWAAPIGQDGIAIIVHPSNPVKNLSTQELRRIYQGQIRNWSELGGSDSAITVLSREQGSGTRQEFERLVMGQRRTTPNAQVVPSSRAMLSRIAERDHAIGYVSMSQLIDDVSVLAVDAVTPTTQSIYDSTYPLRSTIFVVGFEEPLSHYRAFIGWIQGIEGQAIVEQSHAPLP